MARGQQLVGYMAHGVPRQGVERHVRPFSTSLGRIKGKRILARRASGVKMWGVIQVFALAIEIAAPSGYPARPTSHPYGDETISRSSIGAMSIASQSAQRSVTALSKNLA